MPNVATCLRVLYWLIFHWVLSMHIPQIVVLNLEFVRIRRDSLSLTLVACARYECILIGHLPTVLYR